MGQRHQLFVIARINGRYRQLGAIHHPWLYGHTALRRCLDTLKIFGESTNRTPIQQELLAASNKDDDFWLPSTATASYGNEQNGNVPFPFIMTCLIVGASFNTDGYFHVVSVEPFYMEFDEGANNNGKLQSFLNRSRSPSSCNRCTGSYESSVCPLEGRWNLLANCIG